MKILGFANKGDVKKLLIKNDIIPSEVRKVIINVQGFMDVFFHDGRKMQKIEASQFIPQGRTKK